MKGIYIYSIYIDTKEMYTFEWGEAWNVSINTLAEH